MEAEKAALDKAKIQLMSRPDSAFFTTVLFSLRMIWDLTIPTACTNGREIRINPVFFMGLSPEARIALLIHEAMHVAYLHMERLMMRDMYRFNVAADHVINLMLKARGYFITPDWLCDSQYADMNTEQVYDLLPKQDPTKVDMDLRPPPDDEKLREEVADILIRASIQSAMQGDRIGTIPGDIQIFLDKLLDPKLPWHRILRKYIKGLAKNDYSYRKFNRRFFPKYYLPGMESHTLMDLAIYLDTSGSVSDEDFRIFVSEVSGIFRMMKPKKITLVQFDTNIKDVSEIRSINELRQIKFTGRGGTEIGPVIEWANINKPQLSLIFSDGHFRFRTADTSLPVIWVIHNHAKFTAPFGKVIHYSI